MAMGRQEGDQPSMWVATQTLAGSPGHAFYEKLNQVLEQSGFDRYVEELCAPHYAEQGRPSIPPGVYFRMLFIGYFEGLDSQTGDRVAVRRQPPRCAPSCVSS